MSEPVIYERKIVQLKKPNGGTQYFMTIPKGYGDALKARGIDQLIIVSDYTLVALPKDEGTEQVILTLARFPQLRALFEKRMLREGARLSHHVP